MTWRARWVAPPRVLTVGIVLLLFYLGLPTLPSFPNEVDPAALPVESELAFRLRTHVEFLASPDLRGRKPGTAGNRAAAAYISAQFRAASLTILPSLAAFGQTISSEIGDNLIGVLHGQAPLDQSSWLLVGAHYDHLGGRFLGADDNASSVAILLETARTLLPLRHHSILFVAFNAEEPPYIRTSLMGSQYFVDHLPPEIGSPPQFKAVVIMDLLGGVHWPPLLDVLFAAGAEKSPGLYHRVKQASGREAGASSPTSLQVLPVGLHLVEQIPFVGQVAFSDYDAFRKADVPFLFLSAGRTPRYHETTDLPDTLHYERMAATVTWLQNLLTLIDQDTVPYGFQADRIEFADEVASLRPLLALAADPETGIPNTSFLSFWRLRRDNVWLQDVAGTSPTPEALRRVERISIRLQCLLSDFSGCFLF